MHAPTDCSYPELKTLHPHNEQPQSETLSADTWLVRYSYCYSYGHRAIATQRCAASEIQLLLQLLAQSYCYTATATAMGTELLLHNDVRLVRYSYCYSYGHRAIATQRCAASEIQLLLQLWAQSYCYTAIATTVATAVDIQLLLKLSAHLGAAAGAAVFYLWFPSIPSRILYRLRRCPDTCHCYNHSALGSSRQLNSSMVGQQHG